MPSVELRELLHYPFLPEAQKVLASRGISIDSLSRTDAGKNYLEKSCQRVIFAIDGKELYPADDSGDNVSDIVTYVLARILVSCVKDRRIIQWFVNAEAKRVYSALSVEQNMALKQRVCSEFGISMDMKKLSVVQYVGMCCGIRDAKWRLINRDVADGYVPVSSDELEILLCEKIRKYLSSALPLAVPASLERDLQPWAEKIFAKAKERTLEEFGTVEETAFPPCIQTLIEAAAAGANISHSGRFALVTFLHTVGMGEDQIESIFSRSPNYNADMTEYQVNHILTNEYDSMSCATMQTHGVCSHKSVRCLKINHPLNYYRKAKKLAEKKRADEAKRAEKEAAAAAAKAKAEADGVMSDSVLDSPDEKK